MNIVNEKITHSLYGDGKVINQEENKLTIQFSEQFGMKKFIYPDAFEKYLKLCNSDVEILVTEDLKNKLNQINTEKLQKQQEYEEYNKKSEPAKIKLSSPKRKSVSKSTALKKKN